MTRFHSFVEALRVPSHARTAVSVWINDDIKPLPPSRRLWDTTAFVSFWAINQICLTNWQIGAALTALGLSVWQSIIAIIIGKVVIAAVAILNGYVGAKWHIGFPVTARFVWGIYGSYVMLVQRIILSLVWFSVQSWTGGLCVQGILSAVFPSFQYMKNHFPESAHMDTRQFVGWVIFSLLMMPMVYVRPERMNHLALPMNTISVVTLVSMMIWALHAAHGAGPLLTQSSTVHGSSELGWAITSGVSAVIGGIAVGLTNQMDYSRFATRPGDQVFGQYVSILGLGVIMPLFGCLTSSATVKIYGTAYWNPPNLVQAWLDTDYNAGSRAAAFFAGFGLIICQLAINTIDNAYSVGMDLAGLFPTFLNIRRGAFVGLIVSCVMCPWELLSSAHTFISVLSAYSVFLGSMIGVSVCEYWILRRRRVILSDLYHSRPSGAYYYFHGVNWRSFTSWILGWVLLIPGFLNNVSSDIVVPAWCVHLYNLAFPLGFVISFLVHLGINHIWPPGRLGEADEVDFYGTFTHEEASRLGILGREDLEEDEKEPQVA